MSSGFDADKLDYLIRDANAAGLPMRYDLERYLYGVQLQKNVLADGQARLAKLYQVTGRGNPQRNEPTPPEFPHPYYECYRLRLPRRAMNSLEQIVISKLMLYSYIYHHPKVRAAEGLLQKMLDRAVECWRANGQHDDAILDRFMDMTDSSIRCPNYLDSCDEIVRHYAYRLANRLLPREAYGLTRASASHAERAPLVEFLTSLQDKRRGKELAEELEVTIAEELVKLRPDLRDAGDVLARAGVWLDVPRAPEFEDVHEIVIGGASGAPGVRLVAIFPIGQWTEAYTHFKYQVRIFAFSEYWAAVQEAAEKAMQRVIQIQGHEFYNTVRRVRG